MPDVRVKVARFDVGVQVVREVDVAGEVNPVTTPTGQVATLTHVGPDDRLTDAHNAIHAWAATNNRPFAGTS